MSETVLLIDDDESFREVTRFHLEEEGYVVRGAADGEVGLRSFEESPTAVVITDLKMPKIDGMELLPRLLARSPEVLVIVVTAFGDVASAVAAMKAGAFEFLPKPFDRDHLKLTVRRAFEHAALRREVRELKGRLGDSAGKELLFRSDAMERVVEVADRVAGADVTVLILGESGTGKELVARRIHRISPRAAGPFVVVNCGAIPRDLLEDELFGHVKGAFTGATRDRRGRFLQADGGTIVLDEIAELPADLQTRLLRVLRERVVDVVGRDASVPVDIRVIAATNRDLEHAVAEGTFREDLFYRLNVLPLRIPPLRERPEDILLLVRHFLARYGGSTEWTIPAGATARLESLPWRGNVRELENLCQRVALLSPGREMSEEFLPPAPESVRVRGDSDLAMIAAGRIELPPGGVSLEALERDIIVHALELNGHNQSRTARFLQIPRHVLLYRIEKFGIASPPGREPGA
ncbi:MAG: sigma-54-dependent Fis family transcriptional regulator [Deltaproteobacteria bacterium]|nr:sigma-54-dependent Fis family transcriptional regulator [Deltaproteobacteria bacterium]